MARLKIDGIDGVMAEVAGRSERIRPIIAEALTQSAGVLGDALRSEAKSSFKAPSGLLAGKIEPTDVWHMASASGLYVYPQGYYNGVRGSYARRAAEVAFVLEYGRGGSRPMEPNPWNKRAMRKSTKRINSIIVDELGGL